MLINLDSRLNGSVTVKLTFDDDTANQDYAVLSDSSLSVNYTNPQAENAERLYKDMKLYSNLSSVFGLRSANGKRYYKGGEIALRSTMVE